MVFQQLDPDPTVPVQSEIGNLICSRHLSRSTAGANTKFIFLVTYATCSELPSDTYTLVKTIPVRKKEHGPGPVVEAETDGKSGLSRSFSQLTLIVLG